MGNYGKLLAINVGELLNKSGLNQTDFAHRVGLTQPGVAGILAGKMKNPQVMSLQKIAEPFGKTASWLLTDHSHQADGSAPSPRELAALSALLPAAPAAVLPKLQLATQADWDALAPLLEQRLISSGSIDARVGEQKKQAK